MDGHARGTRSATYREISEQTAAWEQALEVVQARSKELSQVWGAERYTNVVWTGCGSTYYLALAAAALFQELTGVSARGVPAGELVMYPAMGYPAVGRTLLVAISRSGETTETLRAVESFRSGKAIVITNYPDRPLARMGAVTIAIPAGQEQSIAQTRSFASMYVAAAAVAAWLAGRQELLQAMNGLPERGLYLLRQYESLAQGLGSDLSLDRFYFLGSGPRYGLACEASLKMKEMSLSHSEPFHFLEFRHGPKSMVSSSALIVGLLSEAMHDYEAAVIDDMRQLGARTLTLGESSATGATVDVAFESRVPEAVRNVLYLPVLQLLAYYRAIAKGLDPDRPHNLDAVVKLR